MAAQILNFAFCVTLCVLHAQRRGILLNLIKRRQILKFYLRIFANARVVRTQRRI